jgi:hypothetical protein
VAVTSTPGIKAPVGSVTVPLICAVAWAHTLAHVRPEAKNVTNKTIEMCFISPSSQIQLEAFLTSLSNG